MKGFKIWLKKCKNKYYGFMMKFCFDRYFESNSKYWFGLFSRYFEKLHKDENLRIVSCEINKTES